MLPKVRFVYSGIYDQGYRNSLKIQENLKKQNKEYPSVGEIKKYIKKIENIWKKEGNKILNSISKASGLKWKDKEIKVYVIGVGNPFSDPLTLPIWKNTNGFIDTLTHELIHGIQAQNQEKFQKWRNQLDRQYKKENETTKNHIFLHAVHKKVYLEIFSEKRLKNDLKKCEKYPDYTSSWQIVETEGYKNIINKFRELTK